MDEMIVSYAALHCKAGIFFTFTGGGQLKKSLTFLGFPV